MLSFVYNDVYIFFDTHTHTHIDSIFGDMMYLFFMDDGPILYDAFCMFSTCVFYVILLMVYIYIYIYL